MSSFRVTWRTEEVKKLREPAAILCHTYFAYLVHFIGGAFFKLLYNKHFKFFQTKRIPRKIVTFVLCLVVSEVEAT